MFIRSSILLAHLTLVGFTPVLAQVDQQIPPTFEFSFSNPGARSMGLGGAFVALADDATAAFANPAGLVQLTRPEVSVEGRLWDYSTPFVEGGRIFGEPTGIGIDDSPGLRTATSSQDLGGLSFLSVVYPASRAAVALYRHQLASYEFAGGTQGLFSGPWPGTGQRREADLLKRVELDIVSYGLSGSVRIGESLSLGLGLTYFAGRLDLQTDSYARPGSGIPAEIFFGERELVPENLLDSLTVVSHDRDWGFLAGLLWRASRGLRVGAFFREGPALEARLAVRAGATYPGPEPAGSVLAQDEFELPFPNVYGLGVAYRFAGDRLTVGCEWDRVEYSRLFGDAPEFVLEDGSELHAGAEYVFLRSTPIVALRLGVWLDPDHRIDYAGSNYVARALIRGGADELHAAAGLGVVLERLQIDLAVDVSALVDTASLSLVYAF